MNFNKVLLAGRLTRDPELRYTSGGTAVCEFGIAVNRTWFDKSTGTRKEETLFADCTAWLKTAETIAKHLRKGREIFVEGRLKLDQWEDRTTGAKRSKHTVTVETFQFVGGPADAAATGTGAHLSPDGKSVRLGPPPAPSADAANHLPPQDAGPTPF